MSNLPQPIPNTSTVLIATSENIAGMHIVETFGVVRGSTVRARNVGHDLLAGWRNITGGEISSYTGLLAQSREQALDRMRLEAAQLGANAVIAVRFTTSAIMQGAAEILVYGTAVRIEPAR
jgi:uncharacterized protein YbjQ (UPF0145 family)